MIAFMNRTAIKKALVFILIISFNPVASGCWNRHELNTLGILGSVAVDMEEEKYKLTFEIIKPKPAVVKGVGGEKEEPVRIIQTTGDSFFEALRNATLKFDRRIFMPHTKVYIFSEEVAKKGLIDFIDFLQRDHETRRSTYVVIAKDSSAAEILNTAGGIEDIPSNYIVRLIEGEKFNSKSLAVKFRELLKYYYDKGKQPTLGIIQIKKKPKESSIKKGETEYELSVEGSAVFLEEKLVGFLDGKETRGLNFVTNKMKGGVIVSPAPNGMGTNTIEILKADSKNDVKIEGEEPKIKVKISLTGMLGEESAKINIKEPGVIEKIEKANSQVIKNEIEDVIRKVQQEYETDIFGFGEVLHKKHPDQWKKIQDNWNEIFSHGEVKVEVETKITRIGLTNTPVNKKEE